MENKVTESDILDILENESIISQRKISEETGISLGMVNVLIKRCVKMGFLKIENLNSRTVKYILTPQGINEKTKKTLRYIKNSYKLIIDLSIKIEKTAKKHQMENKEIFIFGDADEIKEIIERVLVEREILYKNLSNIEQTKNKKNIVIYVWDIEIEERLKKKEIEVFNVIKSC